MNSGSLIGIDPHVRGDARAMIRCFVFESDRKLQVFVELHELLIVASAERSELIRGKGVSERYRAKSREVVFEGNLLI